MGGMEGMEDMGGMRGMGRDEEEVMGVGMGGGGGVDCSEVVTRLVRPCHFDTSIAMMNLFHRKEI